MGLYRVKGLGFLGGLQGFYGLNKIQGLGFRVSPN